jgi:hypothetical protein
MTVYIVIVQLINKDAVSSDCPFNIVFNVYFKTHYETDSVASSEPPRLKYQTSPFHMGLNSGQAIEA